MNLTSYINLYELLKNDNATKEEKRDFGLSLTSKENSSMQKLLKWQERITLICQKPFLSDKIGEYLYQITFVFILVAFVIGIISGSLLLSYNGKEPVNIIYFMAMVVAVPLFTMGISFFSMIQSKKLEAILVHLSAGYWMEKLLKFISKKEPIDLKVLKINPLLFNWLVIQRSQLIALVFSMGLFFSLIAIVATQDIAFAWSSTLKIDTEAFYSFINIVSFPWREFIPSAVPSLELIEQSHYFRLGDKLNTEMIANASSLGQWWKFLAMCTLFYAIFLRFIAYFIAKKGFQKALYNSFFALEGTRELLLDMQEAIVSSHSQKSEKKFIPSDVESMEVIENLENIYDMVQGWSLLTPQLTEINKFMQIESSLVYGVGGGNTLSQDTAIIKKSSGKVLLYVKSWEPPTMDFMDYVEELLPFVEVLIIYPIGTQEDDYISTERMIDIWDKKIAQLNDKKVWIKR